MVNYYYYYYYSVTVVGKIPSQESGCLITVLEAILTRRQPHEKLQCLYENLMLNNFCKTAPNCWGSNSAVLKFLQTLALDFPYICLQFFPGKC